MTTPTLNHDSLTLTPEQLADVRAYHVANRIVSKYPVAPDEHHGSILFPDPAIWSESCIWIIERACMISLGYPPMPIRLWASDVPEVSRSELLLAAADLADDFPDLPTAAILDALRAAVEWLGHE